MSEISLLTSSSIPSLSSSSLLSPILNTATGRSHAGFSSGYGGCCPPVFNPGTLFALISGIALATYFLRLVIVVTEFTKRGFPDPLLLYANQGLHMAEEKFGDLVNVTKTIHENDVESDEGEGWVSWTGGIITELVDLYRQETEESEELVEKKEEEEEEEILRSESIEKNTTTNTTNAANTTTNTVESEWGSCRSEAWHCFSSNMEEGVRNLHRPNDLVGSVQHLLYKAVFHGGLKSMWSSVMELPSARGLGSCLSSHDRCIEHTVLAREVDSAGW